MFIKIKKSEGITLIALVVTIIVLLILAGISIQMLVGEGGILTNAREAKEQDIIGKEKEEISLAYSTAMTENQNENVTKEQFEEELKKFDSGVTVTEDEEKNNIKVTYPNGHEYTVKNNGIIETRKDDENGENNGVAVNQIFDINGKNETDEGYDETKLHIGDFINYDAGSWTPEEINNIQVGLSSSLVTASGDKELSSTDFQFCGFEAGTSKNENATPNGSSYTYVKENGKAITGWRLFDVNDDGSIVLISAGCPEDYCHPQREYDAYKSEYILSGQINDGATGMNLGTTYTKRNWDNYVNGKQKAISAEALTKSRLENWYNKYMENNVTDAFQSVYSTKYETIIDNYSYYWLCSASTKNKYLYYMNPYYREITTGGTDSWVKIGFGVRILVTLSSDVKLSKTSVGAKTITDPRDGTKSWKYNIWDIE